MSNYVGNLSHEVTSEDLMQASSEYETVKQVQIPIGRETGWMRGFGS